MIGQADIGRLGGHSGRAGRPLVGRLTAARLRRVAWRSALTAAPWAGLLLLWSPIRGAGLVSPALLPAPSQVLAQAWALATTGELWTHLLASSARVVGGVPIGTSLALPVGFLLGRFIRAWLRANEALVTRWQELLPTLQPVHYREFAPAQLQSQYEAVRWRSAEDWAAQYRNGSATKILNDVTAFNVAAGAFTDPLPAKTYFDPSLLQEVLAQG